MRERSHYITYIPPAAILGANVLDDEPFLVMELHQMGDARAFLKKNPNRNRLELVCIFIRVFC
jgi:hypothetical protein